MKIFQFITFHIKLQQYQNHDGKIKHVVLFDYRLFDKVCDKIEYLIIKKKW